MALESMTFTIFGKNGGYRGIYFYKPSQQDWVKIILQLSWIERFTREIIYFFS